MDSIYDIENEEVKLYENNGYNVECTSNSVKVILKDSKNVTMPIGVVSILPMIQLKLGEDIEKFQLYMTNLSKNYIILKGVESIHIETWEFIRLQDEDIDEEIKICDIITLNNKIINISYNQELPENKKFRQLERLTTLQQIKFKNKNTLNMIMFVMSRLTHEKITEFRLLENSTGRLEIIHIKSGIKFVFTERFNNYTLASIGLGRAKVGENNG